MLSFGRPFEFQPHCRGEWQSAVEVEGNVIIRNINMRQSSKIISRVLMENTSYAQAISDIADKVDQTAKSEDTSVLADFFAGLNTMMLLIIGAILIGVSIAGFFIYKMLSNPEVTKSVTTLAQFTPAGRAAAMYRRS